ncbi:MAG TPA: ECF transporter S component [Chloroflexia bacterium]|nr:ECF transporter S component [Chloroflexia bacterium]
MATQDTKLKTQNSISPTPALLVLTSLAGVVAFLYPFLLPAVLNDQDAAHSSDAPLLLVLLVSLCLVVLFADLETRRLDARHVALLGIMVATNAALRAVPHPGEMSPAFVLPILAGYVFGGGFGFLLGALSFLVSALFTAGVGPWLPFQMYTMGWVGLSSAALARLVGAAGPRPERAVLVAWGAVVGFAFGAIMNLWFWPFIAPDATADPSGAWDPAASLASSLQRYAIFYVSTSLPFDVTRALGNVGLLAVLALPILKLFRRFHDRFTFAVERGAPDPAAQG